MDPSPSSPPSTIGLVRGDLCATWAVWRAQPEIVIVASQPAVPVSTFNEANDLVRATPAPPKQPSTKDPLDDMLKDFIHSSPKPVPQSSQPVKDRLWRTRSGLLAMGDVKPQSTARTGDNVKTQAVPAQLIQHDFSGKPWSRNSGTQATASKQQVVAAGPSCESPVSHRTRSAVSDQKPAKPPVSSMEMKVSADITTDPPPPKANKRKQDSQVADNGADLRPQPKKLQRNVPVPDKSGYDTVPNLSQLRTDTSSLAGVPPSGQRPVAGLLTESDLSQVENQPGRPDLYTAQFLDEPETVDMAEEPFPFEYPEELIEGVLGMPQGQWTLYPDVNIEKRVAEPPAESQQSSATSGVSTNHIEEADRMLGGNTNSAIADERHIPRASSPLFVSQESAASPLCHRQGNPTRNNLQESQGAEMSTSDTATSGVRISATPPHLTRQHNQPRMPKSPKKMEKVYAKFYPAKNLDPLLPPEATVEGSCTQPEGFRDPEPLGSEIRWKKATAEESLPAVLHNIVTALHRTLGSKEDVIGDVAREYREKALELLDTMTSRHASDRIESYRAHESASHAILHAFSVAEKDMEGLVRSLRALDVDSVMTSVKHPGFLEKLERVCTLYDAKLGKYTEKAAGDLGKNDAIEEVGPKKGKKKHDDSEALIKEFCASLCDKTQAKDEEASSLLQKMHAEADRLLYRLPHDDMQDTEPELAEQPPPMKAKNVLFEALEAEMDTMLEGTDMATEKKDAGTAHDDKADDAVFDGEDSDGSYRE